MHAFLEGILAGYGVAIPVGAIGILIIDIGLRNGFALAFMAGSGAASADLIYVTLAALFGEALAIALEPYALVLRIISAFVLLAIGIYGLARLRRRQHTIEARSIDNHGYWRMYTRFLGLTLLPLPHPLPRCIINLCLLPVTKSTMSLSWLSSR